MSTDFNLSEAELYVIRKFVGSLYDEGVQAHLLLAVVLAFGGQETPARALDRALEDLRVTCKREQGVVNAPENVVDAAPSLVLVVKCARRAPGASVAFQFPEDFLPSDELVQKCLARFFVNMRRTCVGKTSGEG